jgi:hypothetical protein
MMQLFKNADDKKARQLLDRNNYVDEVLGPASLLDDDDIKQKIKFLQEVERLAILVADQSNSAAVSNDCNTLLSETGVLVNSGTPDRSAIIGKLNKIKQRLIRAYDSRQEHPVFSGAIVFVNLAFLGAYIALICVYALVPGQKNLENTAFVCLACALWGGIGGAVDAFFAFYSHMSAQDFDRKFWPWYYFHPILGVSMGAVVFLLFQAGLLAIGGTGLQEAATANTTTTAAAPAATKAIGATALPIAVAFLAGFRQRTAVNFLTRIINSIFQKGDETKTPV